MCHVVFNILFICEFVFVFKQKAAYELRISDWSSDVCSSDLLFHQRNVSRAGNESGLRLSLTMRLGSRSSLQASYDSAYGTSRLSYQRSAGEGVGSYSAGADVERSSAEIGRAHV